MIELQHDRLSATEQQIWKLLEKVSDPEIPVLTVLDLGLVRNVEIGPAKNSEDFDVIIVLTPTYMGCPAMDMISMNIRFILMEHGFKHIKIKTTNSPAWTTDWMSETGKTKLKQYGIAPPLDRTITRIEKLFSSELAVPCPYAAQRTRG